MSYVSRRKVVLSAAAAAAAFGLDRQLAFIPPAAAQKATMAGDMAYKRFNVGDIEVTTLFDGLWERKHADNFVRNATVDELKAALRAQGMPDAYVPITFTITLVKIGDEYVMFDAGTGAQLAPTAGKLADSMKAAGIDPAKIKTVLVTHFHPDHIFGLMAKETNAQIYPNARIVLPEAEMKFWGDPGIFSKLPEARHGLAKRIQATFPKWANVEQAAGEKEVVPGIRAIPTAGHTPGHTCYLVSSGSSQMIVSGDVTNIPVFVSNPGWHPIFDADPVKAEATRRALFDRAVADKVIMTGYHWGMPGAGTIAKDGNGYVYQPIA
jgi:glyoxylase-like metal-dependent hydrolase (beta-lactamase superfamily II)